MRLKAGHVWTVFWSRVYRMEISKCFCLTSWTFFSSFNVVPSEKEFNSPGHTWPLRCYKGQVLMFEFWKQSLQSNWFLYCTDMSSTLCLVFLYTFSRMQGANLLNSVLTGVGVFLGAREDIKFFEVEPRVLSLSFWKAHFPCKRISLRAATTLATWAHLFVR